MIFFVAYADLPSPPPPPAVIVTTPIAAPPPAAPIRRVRGAEQPQPCPLGSFASDGRPCPHPAYYGLAQGSDIPGQTLGSTDPAYGQSLTDQICEAKPWIC